MSDPSHRVWNDIKQAFTNAGLWTFVLVMSIVLNLDYGPWDGAAFHQRSQDAMANILANGGLQHPLFLHFKNNILKDLGWWSRRHDPGLDESLTEELKDTFTSKSTRVSLNRWFGFLRSCKSYNRFWHGRRLAYAWVVIL